eukprot:scaffold101316_cov56-Cyclotella_meneghiniana.AAC.3
MPDGGTAQLVTDGGNGHLNLLWYIDFRQGDVLPPADTMQTMTASNQPSTSSKSNKALLLSHIRSLVRIEQSLTSALTTTQPLLNKRPASSVILSNNNTSSSSLLPLPQKSQITTILATASNYATRTSAPPMWNSNHPVVGFATPNPLPHQLRGGALGGMQLMCAREELKRKKEMAAVKREGEKNRITSKHKDDDAVMMEAAADNDDADGGSSGTKRKRNDLVDDEINPTRATSAKQSEVMEHRQKQNASLSTTTAATAALDRTKRKNDTNREIVTMNLSDSSSDEDSE